MINLQWGTQKNGQIDTELLVDVSGRGDYLEPTAAAQWRRMAAACRAATGGIIAPAPGSSAYRPLSIQKDFYATYMRVGSPVAAVPGTSNHGWGRAVDMTGYEGNTPWRSPRTGRTYMVNLGVWNWLQAHAADYGYDWATGDSSGEAWHWESLTPPGTASSNATTLTGGFLMALSDDEQSELLQKIRELHKIELVPGQGYSWGNAANNAAQAAVDALTKPSAFSGQFRPIDVLVSQVPAILAAVTGQHSEGLTDAQLDTLTTNLKTGLGAELANELAKRLAS